VSEFQYYEFVAVDRPLTPAAMRALRAITSRATITPTRLVNTYQWGDFKGDPLALVTRYFDAFLYYANWGTHRLMLRLPRAAPAARTAARYCGSGRVRGGGGSAVVHAAARHVILEFQSEDESGEWEGEPEGWLGSLIPLRDTLAGGDVRALYLAWLLRAQVGELRGATREPPVPAGLGALTAPLDALVDFLRLDRALLAAAAERSAPAPKPPTAAAVRRWVRTLDPAARDAWLERAALEDGPGLRAEFHDAIASARGTGRRTATGAAEPAARTVAELLRDADARRTAGGRPPNRPRAPDAWEWDDA